MTRYFDHNATSPAGPEVTAACAAAMAPDVGNPSSMHAAGRHARALLDQARRRVAALAGVAPRAIVFTSGATEANNLALRGFAAAHPDGLIAVTEIDHASLLACAGALAADGYRVERLAVDRNARPDYDRIAALTAERACLVATSWANGETGHVADVERLAAVIAPGSLLHLDAAQAAGRIPIRAGAGVHLLAMSAHKFGGPRGTGALVIACDEQTIEPLLFGGPQENGMRPGTENLAGIVGMGVAAELAAAEMDVQSARLVELRERLCKRIEADTGAVRLSPPNGLPNTLTVAFAGVGGDIVTAALDLAGFAVSTGAACAAGAPEPSHVVRGLGVPAELQRNVVRISMGRDTRDADVDALADAIAAVVARARKAA